MKLRHDYDPTQSNLAPVVETALLSDPEELDRRLRLLAEGIEPPIIEVGGMILCTYVRVATRSWSSWNVLEEKKMFLQFEIAENVLELQKIPHIFEKMPYLKRLLKILTYSAIFPDIIDIFRFPICLIPIMFKKCQIIL